MKFLLIVLLVMSEVCAASAGNCSTCQQQIHKQLVQELEDYKSGGIEAFCTPSLLPTDSILANQTLSEFVECGKTTIDLFISKLEPSISFDDEHIAQLTKPVCEIFDKMFGCLRPLASVIDDCLGEREKQSKNQTLSMLLLLQQTACIRNGDLLSEIVNKSGGLRCIQSALQVLMEFGFEEFYKSQPAANSTCNRFVGVYDKIFTMVGKCELPVSVKFKNMLVFFCDGTQCRREQPNLDCHKNHKIFY